MENEQHSSNVFYEKYKDSGTLSLIIPAVSMILVIGTIGILANTAVIIITVFSKNLRSTTNYLLGFQCFFDAVHASAHYYLAYVVYSGKNFDTLPTCLHIMTIPLIGILFGIYLVFLIALDRLIATLFPFRHQRINKFLYLGAIIAICTGITMYVLYIAYLKAEEDKELMVVCLLTESLHRSLLSTITAITVALISGSVLIYILIGIYIHHKGNSSTTLKKLFKSLFILCMISMCSWIFATGNGTICFALGLSEEVIFFISFYNAIPVNAACASNFFVLTRYSSEYRAAAKEFFNRFGINLFFKPIVDNSKVLHTIPINTKKTNGTNHTIM